MTYSHISLVLIGRLFCNLGPKPICLLRGPHAPALCQYPRLKRNFRNSIFACATFNFGPYACSFDHTNPGNLPFGWCAITALGPFDPTQGGHLVLWDLQLVIEFPPGSTILIPSAS